MNFGVREIPNSFWNGPTDSPAILRDAFVRRGTLSTGDKIAKVL